MDFHSRRPFYLTPYNLSGGPINDKPPCASGSATNSNNAPCHSKLKKNSIVITNSNLPTTSQNQSLCRIEFQNKMCLALPPSITWEEINAPPFTNEDIAYLLYYTTQMNSQLKRQKRTRSYRNGSALINQAYQSYVDTRSYASTRNQITTKVNDNKWKPCNSSSVKSKNDSIVACSNSKLKSTLVQTKKTAENRSKEVTNLKKNHAAVEVQTSSSTSNTEQAPVTKPINSSTEETNEICKRPEKVRDILKLRDQKYLNLEIIDCLKKNNILSFKSPFAKGLCRQMPLPASSSTLSSTRYVQDIDLKLEQLLQDSWLESDDDREEKTSKKIYENLANMVENFGKLPDSPSKNNARKKKKKVIEKKPTDSSETDQKKGSEELNESFEEYYDDLTVDEGLKNGSMIQDVLRINVKNWREAYVPCFDSKDIFVDGIKNRNRALDSDEVVVELIPDEKLSDSENETSKTSTQKCGKVIRIVKQNHPRTAVGSIKRVYLKKKCTIWLCPIDSRLPRVKILLDQCAVRFKNRFLKINTVYLAKITNWETTNNAEGIILEELGDEEDTDVETKCILLENFLDVTPFESADEYIPTLPYQIPDSEISERLDIRNCCVFTIDPPGAKDLDDALSCTVLDNGIIEIGVHIADVTHFLQADTPLDLNAREKATSVYLTEKVYHMLPFSLCQLCSLTPDKDKLAFSVFIQLDEYANVVNHVFKKTVIRSCAQLTYAHAQDVIERFNENYEPTSFPPVVNGFTAKECAVKIRILHTLASRMRKRRFEQGALKIDQPKIVFSLDEDQMPYSFSLYIGKEANWLIEEFMLLANILAATKIRECFPKTALLRFHPPPKEKLLSIVVEFLEKVGICIDATDAGSIYQSMVQYEGSDEIGAARMAVITNLLVKPMVKASYACSSSNEDQLTSFWHYALNTPFYTHFTSPIRRYADIVVHRFLAASISCAEAPNCTPKEIKAIANVCNAKKNSSKKASETSTELYLKIYLESYGPLKVRAVVIDVKERYFECIDLTTRSTNRVMVNKIQGFEKVEFEDESVPTLKVTWSTDFGIFEQIIQIFTIVDVELSYKKCSGQRLLNKINIVLLKPSA